MRNKAGLMSQLRNNRAYRARVAKHFGVSESEIVAYAQENLQYSRLRQPMRTSVWGLSRTGKSFRVTQNMPAGTPVFRVAGGPPVLKEVCGNPVLTPVLPPVPRAVRRRGAVLPPGPLAINSIPGIEGFAPSVPGVIPESVPVIPGLETSFAPVAATFPGEMVPTAAGIAPGAPVGGGGGFVPPFWLLAGAGAAFIHGSGGNSFTPPKPPPPPPSQVPEPGSMLLLAAGVLPLAGALRRRGGSPLLPMLRFSLRR